MIKSCLHTALFFILCTSTVVGQIEFEPGYYVTNSGEKIVGQIGNELWRLAPQEFLFIDQNGQKTTIAIEEASGFGIEGKEKYQRATVGIDQSTDIISEMTEFSAPVFDTQTVFLLIKVKGNATLYQYLWEGYPRFFLSTDGGEQVSPLVYKQYRPNDEQIGENVQFRQQLLAKLSDQGIEIADVRSLRYAIKDLTKLIEKANNTGVSNVSTGNFIRERTEIGLRAGLTRWTLNLESRFDPDLIGPNVGGRVGVDFAVMFPLKRASIATCISPNLSFFRHSTELRSVPVDIKYMAIDVPFGLRVYFSSGESSRIFVGGGYSLVVNIPASKFEYESGYYIPILTSFGSNTLYGELGLAINKNYSIQVIHLQRDIWSGVFGGFSMTSLVFGINL